MPKPKTNLRGMNEAKWEELVNCLKYGKSLQEAADDLGIDVKTARKARDVGYPPGRVFSSGKPPISRILDEGLAKTRGETAIANFKKGAETQAETAERLLAAIANATSSVIDSHNLSGVSIQLARNSVVGLLGQSQKLSLVAAKIIADIESQIGPQIDEATGKTTPGIKFSVEDGLKYLRLISQFTRDSTEIMKVIEELEKNHIGDTGAVQKLVESLSRVDNISADEAEHILGVTDTLGGVEPKSEFVEFDDEEAGEVSVTQLQNKMGDAADALDEDEEDEYEQQELETGSDQSRDEVQVVFDDEEGEIENGAVARR